MSFLLLPHLKVQSANAMACGFIINSTPIMAITQFVHNLVVRHMDCDVLGVAVRHHHAEHQALEDVGYDVMPHQRRSAVLINERDYVGKGSQGPTLSAQPTASCNLDVSLLIEFEGINDEDALQAFLRTARLAGGQVISHGKPETADTADEALKGFTSSGHWLIERPELIEETDPLGSAFDAMERTAISAERAEQLRKESPDDQNRPLHEITHAWVVPTVLGYQAITDFAEREGVRLQTSPDTGELTATRHAYAEPLIGMVQYVPARSWDQQIPFWRQHWLDADTLVVQCHSGAIE